MIRKTRQIGKKLLNGLAGALVRPLAPLFGYAARTGAGSEACIRAGFLPMPIHYYSPVPDFADLAARRIWAERSELPGLDFAPERQLALLARLGQLAGDECRWPLTNPGDPAAFHLDNPSFSFGCAAAAHSLLRMARPQRVIEIGSGYSSRVIAAALARNAADGAPPAGYTIVDPYPRLKDLPGLTRLIPQRVELLGPDFFAQLQDGDVLFIDSGHTARAGGDVNFLILEVLPRLAPGVYVHFHDIPMPWEYPAAYFTRPLRYLWTESYLLQAFLAFNPQFEILLGLNYLMTAHPAEFRAAFPHYDPEAHKAVSGSFWLRRKNI